LECERDWEDELPPLWTMFDPLANVLRSLALLVEPVERNKEPA
jgi:hypothetical protein